jgi:hypothetical protein
LDCSNNLMDKNALITNLNRLFCDLGKQSKKYIEVWLAYVDFGGLYHSDKFVLNVRSAHKIYSLKTEISDIIFLLYDKAPSEYPYIYQVVVHGNDDDIHCTADDLMVYEANKTLT